MPAPAKPPDGVELKVPADDIRFSGVKLRFLLGLLEAIEPHPVLHRTTGDLVSHLVRPLTAEPRCRLLDLVPHEHRGQPHHYVCHAWSCSARELLQTLKREMTPPAPPKPPPFALSKPAPGRGPKTAAAAGDSAADDAAALAAMLGSPDAVWAHYDMLNQKYQEELSKALDQVVWIDFVCHNQNQHAAAKKDYGRVAKTVVGCGSTVLLLDPQLTPLSRTWCLFEVMHCLRCKRHLKVFRVDAAAREAEANAVGFPGLGGGGGGGGGRAGGGGGPKGGGGGGGGGNGGGGPDDKEWEKAVESVNVEASRASSEQDRVGILQEILNTVGLAYVNDTIRNALRLSNADRARQLALRREQLRTTMDLLAPDPREIGTEEYEDNLAKCKEHLQEVLEQFYPEDIMRCIIPKDYVSDSARVWDFLGIFAEILERELFREDAKALRAMAWLLFKRHSKRYIEVLYCKELENWLADSLEHDRKFRRVQAKLKHDAMKKWS
ncbi:hypothetical protein HXX76_015544 [Chlamydomonas incerta]|uniref:Uncharacterized protein n=1 Tax=Chlamydomonas incerta TaxID=51695 RepID=A0A835SA70_CHLIN|nr:hypothetical protein HXX76_015544 [Chlamydomonas incerta]|eukprot:KAG2423159.1 hypothetical protein HXX76_015544 [Chlamydomonas incerta]